ncbi:MAG: copper amine oxidase N-terminal domain-containing protein [Oscillospiraceae bacterium]
MKNTTKRILASLTAIGMLSSGAVFAEYNPDKVIDPNAPATKMVEPTNTAPNKPIVNGATIYSIAGVMVEDHLTVPVRAVAEQLGYTVEWHEADNSITLTKGARQMKLALGSDEYSFGRMAPVKLGMAPVLVDDSTTHVPIEFVTDIMGCTYSKNEDGTLKIVSPSIVSVKEIMKDGSILVNDGFLGDVVLHISDETVFTNGTKADLKVDGVLGVEYSQVMTASMPPQTTAVSINFENVEKEAPVDPDVKPDPLKDVAFEGKILAKESDEVFLVGKSLEDRGSQIRLNVPKDLIIKKDDDKRAYNVKDLEVGMEIEGTHSPAVGFSLPAYAVAVTLEIDTEEDEDEKATSIKYEGEITAIDEKQNQVTIKDDDKTIVLNLSDETVISFNNTKRLYRISDLKVGMEISGTHSLIMTRSIPPQTPVFTIEIEEMDDEIENGEANKEEVNKEEANKEEIKDTNTDKETDVDDDDDDDDVDND